MRASVFHLDTIVALPVPQGAFWCIAAICANLCMLLELLCSFAATCRRKGCPPRPVLALVEDCLP